MYARVQTAPVLKITKGDYYKEIGKKLTEDDDPAEMGYVIQEKLGKSSRQNKKQLCSWIPIKLFKTHFRLNGQFGFEEALHFLKRGKTVRRTEWDARFVGLSMDMFPNDSENKNRQTVSNYGNIYMLREKSRPTPWIKDVKDILAEDWEIVENNVGEVPNV